MSASDSSTDRGRPARRQAEIAEHVLQHGSVSATELAELFHVSLMTIHRDLDELERQGVVRKFRGGVSAQPSSVFESNVSYRLRASRQEKLALARRARELIEPGMAVMLDDSTSTLELARLLHDAAPLTVITNFLETIKLLSGVRGIRLLSLVANTSPPTARSSASPASRRSRRCGWTCCSPPPRRSPAATRTTRSRRSSW